MGHKTVLAAGSVAVAIAALMLTPAFSQNAGPSAPAKTPSAAAANAEDAAAKKKNAAAAALKSYDAGARAYESGKLDTAIQSLSAALSSGGLQSQQMAKALYYRGAAYRKQGKPAQAISDLTTAVWLKNGLSDTDRALAIDQRQGAYREAGLGDSAPPVSTQRAEAPAAAAAAPAPVPAAPALGSPAVNVSNPGQSSGGLFSWFNFGGSPQPAAAPAPVAAAPAVQPPQAAVSSWSTTESAAAPVAVPAPVAAAPAAPSFGFAPQTSNQPSPAPAAPVQTALNAVPAEAPAASQPAASGSNGPSTLAEAGKAVTGFFGNLFSGNAAGAQATQTSSSPVLTSSTGSSSPATNAAVEWGQATSVVTPGSALKPVAGAPGPVAAAAAPAGKYKLQVAAVRSRDEAGQLATRLMQQHAGRLGSRQPEIDEAVIGNMGTFYRVRVGPFASADEPGQLCTTLRPQGFDCLVVSQ